MTKEIEEQIMKIWEKTADIYKKDEILIPLQELLNKLKIDYIDKLIIKEN